MTIQSMPHPMVPFSTTFDNLFRLAKLRLSSTYLFTCTWIIYTLWWYHNGNGNLYWYPIPIPIPIPFLSCSPVEPFIYSIWNVFHVPVYLYLYLPFRRPNGIEANGTKTENRLNCKGNGNGNGNGKRSKRIKSNPLQWKLPHHLFIN